jgi:perosamine synthetase
MIITDDEDAANRARHITTTAKIPHRWEFVHDEVGYNYRMSNISAAIGVAQMEILESVIKSKRELAEQYREFFEKTDIDFYTEGENCLLELLA